jgi:hypothetical protein
MISLEVHKYNPSDVLSSHYKKTSLSGILVLSRHQPPMYIGGTISVEHTSMQLILLFSRLLDTV